MKFDVSINKNIWRHPTWVITLLLVIFGCTLNDQVDEQKEKLAIPFAVELSGFQLEGTRSIETLPPTVNRVLILPFKKIDEAVVSNDDNNFNLDLSAVKQVDIHTATSYHTMVELTQGSTYKLFAVGYNNNDYNHDQPLTIEAFKLLFSTPNLINSYYLSANHAAHISDIFSATGQPYTDSTPVGVYFKPEEIHTLKFYMRRWVSGLNISITNIPDYVSSMTLVAEKLVKASYFTDHAAFSVVPEDAPDSLKTFSTQFPVGGNITFSHYLLPTLEINKTRLFLDVQLGTLTERYPIKVNDIPNTSTGDSLRFYPNQAIKIEGDYANINIGFLLNYTIDLEDDEWDGIE